MSNRPPIPAELRRRVLLEAGHRCAVHTCLHPDVDVHHIEPWARCREHRYENLIALCPNCHRRAELDEIDRPSLRMYKARLGAAFHFDISTSGGQPSEDAKEPSSDPQNWAASQIVDSDEKHETVLEFPQFRGPVLGASTAFVNRYIRHCVDSEMKVFRTAKAHSIDLDSSIPHQLHCSFSVALLRSEIVSVRLSFSGFAGGAHSAHWTRSINIWTTPPQEIPALEIFQPKKIGLASLADYCREHLLATLHYGTMRDPNHVTRGTQPSTANFKAFNLTPEGVLVTFDEYQVGCYAEGASEVLAPYSKLPHIKSEILSVVRRDT